MEGEWKVSDKEVYEAWKPSDTNILTGEAYTVKENGSKKIAERLACLLYTSPSPRDRG